ncbi:MAG: hypothetical protein ABSE21_02715 [Bryobacteraceae bacterium]
MVLPSRVDPIPDDLSGIVDRRSPLKHPAGVGGQERIQIEHAAAPVQEGMSDVASCHRVANDLSAGIDSKGLALIATERFKIGHHALRIEKGTIGIGAGGDGRIADDLSAVVNSIGGTVIAAERAQVGHDAARVQKRTSVIG